MNLLLHRFEMMDEAMGEILRQKSEAERLRIAGKMWQSARVILRGVIRAEQPMWDEERVNQEIARRMSHGLIE